MSYKHLFKAKLNWDSEWNSIASNTKKFTKSHSLFKEKKELHVSAAKAFKGDPELYNPEDLLLSSIVSSYDVVFMFVLKTVSILFLSRSS
jgi:organic hydroperoxide reductase OsmC/OhrA